MTVTTFEVDPSIPQDLVDEALAGRRASAPFQELAEQNSLEAARGFAAVVPATPREAIANAKALCTDSVNVGIGRCLETVRMREFIIPPRDPSAELSWENSTIKHHQTDPLKIPRGAPTYFINGRFGHIVESVGGGLCWTTDFHRPGFVDLALISRLGAWCGGQLVGWSEMLEGVDVWPSPKKPAPKPQSWTLQDRLAFIEHHLTVAEANHASQVKIDGLKLWRDHIKARVAVNAKGRHTKGSS